VAVRTSIEQRLTHTPTIAVIDQVSRLADYAQLSSEREARMLPRYYREILWRLWGASESATGGWPDGGIVRSNFRNAVRQLHDAGVTIHVGTDVLNPFVVPGTSMHQELRNLTGCGFTPEEAWAAATWGNGASLPAPQLGVIETGAPADLLVFREDPTRDLAALATLEAVVANGRFYSKATLDQAVARYRSKFDGWLYDQLTQVIVKVSTRQ
jgi:Amidohydrolase family